MKYFVFEKIETKKCVNISKRMRSTYTYINQNRQIKQQQQMTIATTTSPNLFLSENTL